MPKKSKPQTVSRAEQAGRLIQDLGARVTAPRRYVLAALLGAGRALSHHEVEAAARAAGPIDRVTVYRVLEWLTAHGLAHKIAGADRLWRFSAAGDEPKPRHPHFTCTRCGQIFCLKSPAATLLPELPPGFESQGVEITVRGLCRHCA